MSIVDQQTVIDAIYSFINTSIGDSVDVFEGEEGPQDHELPICLFTIEDDEPIHPMNKEFLDVNVSVTISDNQNLGSKVVRTIMDILVEDLDTNAISVDGYSNEIVFVTDKGALSIEDEVTEIEMTFNLRGF